MIITKKFHKKLLICLTCFLMSPLMLCPELVLSFCAPRTAYCVDTFLPLKSNIIYIHSVSPGAKRVKN